MAHTNVQLVSGNLTTGETEPTFFIDRVNNKVGIKTVPDPTDSNVFQINGGVVATQLYGDGSQLTGLNDSKWIESISNPDDIYYSLGNVGVGTDNPNFTLDVNGDINFTGTFNRNGEEFESSPWTRSGDDLTYITGNVGIGTTDTDHTLTVQGNFNIKNTMTAKQVENQLFWATRIGGDDSDYGQGIAVDSGGNVYVTGRYRSNPVTLYSEDGVTTETLTNDGNYDVFIAKYSTDGNVLWAARIGGIGAEYGLEIAVDSGGNVYVTGHYSSNPVTLYNEDESDSKTLTNAGGPDVFIAKYGTEYRVGVGIENPTSALDVAGQVKANGTILTFTGQHICTPEGPMDQGLIVSANKNMYTTLNGPLLIGSRAIQSSESLPVVCLSSIENDPSVFGVVDHLENGGTQRLQDRGGIITKSTKIIGDDRVIVNSSGEGAMWVVDTNGSLLATGDYITTSSISGYGHKQDDDILHSYTVAKITMDCNFNPDDLPIQVIKKDEDGNNVLDKYGRLQWEDTDRVEKAYQVRYLTSEGEVTDEANAVWTAAYVGCTYHCG